jgi:hypothetical protein
MKSKRAKPSNKKTPASEQSKGDDAQGFSPSEFMRARRPEMFSDSSRVSEAHLPREVFEYHLDTLTSRKQETEFEHFCRRLAEKQLCPNLLPQTGPTGGGDSKVDAETYPVADEISLRWYEGLARSADQERWAFAFSAKKQWRPKIESDVEKIVNTGRGYKLIYFITNQFVRDKVRATVEDKLKAKYRVEVRILDRTWLVECIYEHGRLQIAIEALNLTGYSQETQRVAGPYDTEREAALRELEEQIADPDRYRGVKYQLAEDCLSAALLARGLELPRVEVEGRLLRAERVADQVGHRQQLLRMAYNRAWTAFWWYDDFAELNRVYDRVEELAAGSPQIDDLERLSNLWTVLWTTVRLGSLDSVTAKLEARTGTLKSELNRLAAETSRRNTSLQARTLLTFMDLQEAHGDLKRYSAVLKTLKEILTEAEGLVAYPMETTVKIVREIGDYIGDNEAYDDLFESVVSLTEHRVSEGEAGRVLLERGHQKLRAGKRYDAIRLLGRAQQRLAMREYRNDLIEALLACGIAYKSAGLLWAARANVLAAANQAFSDYWEDGEISRHVLFSLHLLVWLELQLGRVPCVLGWVDLMSVVARQLALDEDDRKAFIEKRVSEDRVLGILLLKAGPGELESLGFLPDVLDELELHNSWMALLYALGHEDYLRAENVIPAGESQEDVRTFFSRWLRQPAADDLPAKPDLLCDDTVTLRSNVLGCEVFVESANNLESIHLSETVVGALEAFLATSLGAELMPYRSQLRISIAPSDAVQGMPECTDIEDETGQMVAIRHHPNFYDQVSSAQDAFRSWVQNLLIDLLVKIAVIKNPESYLKKLLGNEVGLGRALNFTETAIPVRNILGAAPKVRLSEWKKKEASGRLFPLRRSSPWYEGLGKGVNVNEGRRPHNQSEHEETMSPFVDENLKHGDRRILSFIDLPLWDRAGWKAAVYLLFPELDRPPALALGFANAEAAQSIFRSWRKRIGEVDKDEQLKISIITGIDKSNPFSYKITIGTNSNSEEQDSKGKYVFMVSRTHRMDPQNHKNLDGFLKRYERLGVYMLLPAHYASETEQPKLFLDLWIAKSELTVRPAWQIGENDPEINALTEDDDPIIPKGVKNAPVIRTLQKLRSEIN